MTIRSTRYTKNRMGRCIDNILHELLLYSQLHEGLYNSKIAEDGVIGADWLSIMQSLRHMLNGETGLVDCGKMSERMTNITKGAGFEDV